MEIGLKTALGFLSVRTDLFILDSFKMILFMAKEISYFLIKNFLEEIFTKEIYMDLEFI
jgi:hypothetical protein